MNVLHEATSRMKQSLWRPVNTSLQAQENSDVAARWRAVLSETLVPFFFNFFVPLAGDSEEVIFSPLHFR